MQSFGNVKLQNAIKIAIIEYAILIIVDFALLIIIKTLVTDTKLVILGKKT